MVRQTHSCYIFSNLTLSENISDDITPAFNWYLKSNCYGAKYLVGNYKMNLGFNQLKILFIELSVHEMPFEAQGEIETIRQEFNSTFSIVRSAIKKIFQIYILFDFCKKTHDEFNCKMNLRCVSLMLK
jgi:hypothetical protein